MLMLLMLMVLILRYSPSADAKIQALASGIG